MILFQTEVELLLTSRNNSDPKCVVSSKLSIKLVLLNTTEINQPLSDCSGHSSLWLRMFGVYSSNSQTVSIISELSSTTKTQKNRRELLMNLSRYTLLLQLVWDFMLSKKRWSLSLSENSTSIDIYR